MEMTMRWYGSKWDTVTLKQIRQTRSVTGIITTLYDTVPGEVWPRERIRALKEEVEAAGLHLAGIESVNIHDDIKAGKGDRDRYIANYIQTLENLGKEDIHLVCYNFMPVFDWTRTELARLRGYLSPTLRHAQAHNNLTVFQSFVGQYRGSIAHTLTRTNALYAQVIRYLDVLVASGILDKRLHVEHSIVRRVHNLEHSRTLLATHQHAVVLCLSDHGMAHHQGCLGRRNHDAVVATSLWVEATVIMLATVAIRHHTTLLRLVYGRADDSTSHSPTYRADERASVLTTPAAGNAADGRTDDMSELAAHVSATGGITGAGTHQECPTYQP